MDSSHLQGPLSSSQVSGSSLSPVSGSTDQLAPPSELSSSVASEVSSVVSYSDAARAAFDTAADTKVGLSTSSNPNATASKTTQLSKEMHSKAIVPKKSAGEGRNISTETKSTSTQQKTATAFTATVSQSSAKAKSKADAAASDYKKMVDKYGSGSQKAIKARDALLNNCAKLSKKDPETAKEILKVLEAKTQETSFAESDKIAIANELIGHMKNNEAFTQTVINFIEDFIQQEVTKTSKEQKNTLFRQTPSLASSCLTAVQNKSLEGSLPNVAQAIKDKTPSNGFASASDDQKTAAVKSGLQQLAGDLKSVSPAMQKIYKSLYIEVEDKFGSNTADIQLASCLMLKTVCPHLINNQMIKEGTFTLRQANNHVNDEPSVISSEIQVILKAVKTASRIAN